MSKVLVVYSGIAIATLFGHYALNTQRNIEQMKWLIKLSDQKEKIQEDQTIDLMYSLQQATFKGDIHRSEGYVAGVVDGINRPNYYKSIWHDGYDRGSSVQEESNVVMNAAKESSLNKDKK